MPRFASPLSFSLDRALLSLSLSPRLLPYRTLFHSDHSSLSLSFSPFLGTPPLLLYHAPSYSLSPSLSCSHPSFSLSLTGSFFSSSHVCARERVYGMSFFLPRFRCAPTLKRQLTIGAIHGLLARINCRRKLLRLCRVRVESSPVESKRTRGTRGIRYRGREYPFFGMAHFTIHSTLPQLPRVH